MNEKPVWKKKFQENPSMNTSLVKNEWFGEILRHSKAALGGAQLKKKMSKNSQISQENTYVGVCF